MLFVLQCFSSVCKSRQSIDKICSNRGVENVSLTEPRAVLQTREFSSFIFCKSSLISSLISISLLAATEFCSAVALPLVTASLAPERRFLLMVSLDWVPDVPFQNKYKAHY